MIKRCVICGAEFYAPPSSKKITCSRECSARRKVISHTGVHNAWNETSRRDQSKRLKAQGYSESAKRGLAAAMALPESQRGPRHRDAKVWLLIDPEGQRYRVVNLLNWAREHAHWFDTPADEADRLRVANNISSGFKQIVQSRLGHRKHPVYTYKGWSLGDWPRDKEDHHEEDHQ